MAFDFKNSKNAADPAAWNSVGKMMASEIGVGLSENSYLAITALEEVYVKLETVTKNAAKNAENLAKKRQKRELENLKTAKELELVTEQEYYEKLKEYRDKNLEQGTDAWFKCTEEIAAYNKKLLKEQEELHQQMAEKIIKLREELAEKLKKSDEPWIKTSKTTFKGMGVNGTDLIYSQTDIEDFEEEIRLLENFRDRIIELKNLGNIPDGIFSELADMDLAEGLRVASYLVSADPETRDKFVKGYTEKAALADSAAGQLNGILNAEELKKEGIYSAENFAEGFVKFNESEDGGFIKILEKSFESVPDSYYELGGKSGDAFGKGLVESIPQFMEQARSRILAEMQSIADGISEVIRGAAESASPISTTSYTNTYNFNSSRDTTTQQLRAAKNAASLERLRGVEQ
ncbi:MAG: hypothetical protein E7401_03435 [Ruminococcaceae bacterium]|nr:hypothetical protein [Oscillospiraceae bacterium]